MLLVLQEDYFPSTALLQITLTAIMVGFVGSLA